MKRLILEKNPFAEVQTYNVRAGADTRDLVRELVRWCDITVLALDHQGDRMVLNEILVEENKPFVVAGAFRRAYGGQVLRVRPHVSPCYQCFLMALPEQAANEEISSPQHAGRIAYSDRPVPIEAGLSTDIAPISLLVVKLVLQELLHGKETSLRSLDDDLVAPLYRWLNRREPHTGCERLPPLGFGLNGMRILRWYGVNFPRDPACPCCGDFVGQRAAERGLHIQAADMAAFANPPGEFQCC